MSTDASLIQDFLIPDFHKFVKTNFPSLEFRSMELQFYIETGKPNYAYFDLWVSLEEYPFKNILLEDIVIKFATYFKSMGFIVDVESIDVSDKVNSFGICVFIFFQDDVDVSIRVY